MNFFFAYLFIINIIGLLAFFIDKRKAQKNQYRIPEKTLFLLAFLGGGIGCWIGMKLFRHKTKHLSFVIGVPAIAIVEYVAGITMYYFFIK